MRDLCVLKLTKVILFNLAPSSDHRRRGLAGGDQGEHSQRLCARLLAEGAHGEAEGEDRSGGRGGTAQGKGQGPGAWTEEGPHLDAQLSPLLRAL